MEENRKEEDVVMECYVDFLNKDRKYREDRKDFETYNEAWEWIQETFDSPNKDFIGFY